MGKLSKVLRNVLIFISITVFILITIIGVWQVASRFVFNKPAAWTEEVLTYGFVWLALLSSALVAGNRDHMRLTFIIDKFRLKSRIIVEIINEFVTILFVSATCIYGGIAIMNLTMIQVTPALQAPMGLFYGILPVTGILIDLFCINNIINISKGKITESKDDLMVKEGN